MDGKYSISARNLKDKEYAVLNYDLSFIKWIFLGIKCFIKYEVVSVEKHA